MNTGDNIIMKNGLSLIILALIIIATIAQIMMIEGSPTVVLLWTSIVLKLIVLVVFLVWVVFRSNQIIDENK
jgi:hypothetical protein